MTAPLHDATSAPRGRGRWWLLLPLALVVLLAAGWTAAWFYAAGRAEREIEAWIATEAQAGRQWSCADRQLTGFPFRFELVCAAPKLVATPAAGTGGWQWTATRAVAVAQVWNPRHIIAEFEAPSTLTEPATGRTLTGTWSLLQVSAVGTGGIPERVSLATDDYALAEGATALFSAKHAEIHARHHPGAEAGTLDLALGVKQARTPATGNGTLAVDGELQATVTQLPPLRAMPAAERLQLWQQAGGKVTLSVAKLSAGGGTLNATGEIGLDAQRRPTGMITLTLVNGQALIGALGQAGMLPEQAASLAPLLMAAGMPTTLDGAKASAFPFLFRDGRVALGILPLGKIGPLY